ncbi:MAG: sensor histidine kinase [Bacteroidetes bacterium]|nr:sensor histidine kinase [Bacteroidota bacterium]
MQYPELIFALLVIVVMAAILITLFVVVLMGNSKLKSDLLKETYRAQEEERSRIAEDLHDDIGPRLSAMKLAIDLLKNDLPPEDIKDIADESSKMIDKVIKDIRVIVRNLASKYITEKGIYHQLHELINFLHAHHSIKFEFDAEVLKDRYDQGFELSLYRMIQEMINNSIKYSGCTDVKINVHIKGDRMFVNYNDNGKGFDEDKIDKGLGLASIKWRIKNFNGSYEFRTAPGKGVRYYLVFDIDYVKLKV